MNEQANFEELAVGAKAFLLKVYQAHLGSKTPRYTALTGDHGRSIVCFSLAPCFLTLSSLLLYPDPMCGFDPKAHSFL